MTDIIITIIVANAATLSVLVGVVCGVGLAWINRKEK